VEVDTKFSKIIDKECETVSAEIRKWFKKLAKEEKSHDERLASANDKINKAGEWGTGASIPNRFQPDFQGKRMRKRPNGRAVLRWKNIIDT
jgi:hypothetical protein